MTEGTDDSHSRLVAWNLELQAAHRRLRRALQVAQESVEVGASTLTRDILLYCKGFCVALGGHHLGEDRALFPELVARHPELRPTIARLEQDHNMIAHLLAGLEHALQTAASREQLSGHLSGIAAIMESHFRYEERELLPTLAQLDLDLELGPALGPL